MKRAEDDLPLVGANSRELGVRIPPSPNADVDLDRDGNIVLNGKGMSVAENWRYLLPHLVPKRLRLTFPGATGTNNLACFKLGNGPFGQGAINSQLSLILKGHNSRTGNVVPSQGIQVEAFQAELAATRSDWSIDET